HSSLVYQASGLRRRQWLERIDEKGGSSALESLLSYQSIQLFRVRGGTMDQLWRDLRYGARKLLKETGFTLISVLTLALGIGANTAIFSVINALILNPPHIAEAGRVAAIWRTPKDKRAEGYVSYLELQDWRAQNRSFEAIAAYKPNGFILLNEEQ